MLNELFPVLSDMIYQVLATDATHNPEIEGKKLNLHGEPISPTGRIGNRIFHRFKAQPDFNNTALNT